jgi:phage baseplate assembly protein gpV
MRSWLLLLALVTLFANPAAVAAPSLTSPATAQAGSKVTFQVTGSGNPRDFVTIVPKGAREGQYRDYFYVENREKVLVMPAQAGDYEVRLMAADSPYKTLVMKPIKITAVSASVKGPASAAAGSEIEISWTGPDNDRDYVAIGETTPNGRKYLDYKYTRDGSPIRLKVPEAAGTYEIRYLLGQGDTIIARQALTVGAVSAALKGPAQVAAGAKFQVSWTGPDNARDFVTIVKAGAAERTYQAYEYTSKGKSLEFTAPEQAGEYEIRYLTGGQYQTLARAKLTVGAVSASLKAPAQVAAGAKFQVSWTGPDNPKDFLTVVKAGAAEKSYERYEYTSKGSTLTFNAPDVPGQYEIRYASGQQYVTVARAALTVTAVTGTVTAPASVVAGESFKISWKGPDNARNFVTIVPKGAREGEYSSSYFYTTPQNNPGSVIAPLAPGAYEVRYSTAEKYLTLAKSDLTVTPAKNEPGKVTVTLAAGQKSGAIEIILDASGSMLQKLGNERRIDIAKRTLHKLVGSTIPAGTPFAFRVFGREVDSCQTDLDIPVAPLNVGPVQQRINALVAKNGAKTPIGASLEKAADDLKAVTGEKLIVLVTDGEETCGGDPAAAIASLRKAGVSTRVSIVGFALDDAQLAATFRRWSDAGGGAFFDAKDGAALDQSLIAALRPGFEIINAQGQVLASGITGGEPVTVPAGNHQVRIKGRTTAAKPVVVRPRETAAVVY